MIPRSLHLTDFLSYREMTEPLDLSGVTLACLSGPNGHGKSALLDAITWALWGKARGCEGGQEQERLIRDGADAMRVEFVFSLEGQTFRVARTRWRTGKGDVLFAIQAADGAWTDLAGEGIADTQRRIIERLRMDYETFVASAFILQGRADTFTRLDPRHRKEVLGKILGLEVYERLAERARERRRDAQGVAEGHARVLEALDAELAGREEHERARAAAAEILETATAAREAARAEEAGLREQVTALRAVEAAAVETRRRRDDAARAAGEEEERGRALEREIADLSASAVVAEETAREAAAVPGLEAEERRLDAARARHDDLAGEAGSLEARIGEERSRLEAEQAAHGRQADALEAEVAAEPDARRVLADAEGRLAALDGLAERREALLARHAEIRETLGALDAQGRARDAERAETREKIALLSDAGAGCPLCGQKLTAEHRKEVRAGFAARIRELDAADAAAAKERKALAAEQKTLEKEQRTAREALEARESVAEQAAALRQRIERLGAAREQMDAARAAAASLAGRLAAQDYSRPEREKLARVREEIASVGYDPTTHRAVRERLDAARAAERTAAAARHAEAAILASRREAAAAAGRAAAARASMAEAEEALRTMGERLQALPGLRDAEAAAERAHADAQAQVEEATRALAASDRTLEALEQKAAEAGEARDALAQAKRAAGRYERLAKAFGRDGIPARIIGNAIPELRHEANRLLAMLTDGQLSVSIDPVRETKSKAIKETLEVTVYDVAGGKRPYEMYSGGERLRIDFALRVALSRLLATRAGARLETLVVDEGFGSQDAEGRQRLLEAVLRIRSEFAAVLVITHIEDLKEHFPVRIEIRKDPARGSVATVV